jgi:hypothetical protein
MDWKSDSSGREPALQVRNIEFKPQSHTKKEWAKPFMSPHGGQISAGVLEGINHSTEVKFPALPMRSTQ